MKSKAMIKGLLLASVLSLATVPAGANLQNLFGQSSSNGKFLPVNQAFKVNATQNEQTLTVNFTITPEHYIYQDKLKLSLPEGVSASPWKFSRTPTSEDDPQFGKVAVFDQNVTATTTLTNTQAVNTDAKIRWQGCARAGLCYAPETVTVKLTLSGKTSNESSKTEITSSTKTDNNDLNSTQSTTSANPTKAAQAIQNKNSLQSDSIKDTGKTETDKKTAIKNDVVNNHSAEKQTLQVTEADEIVRNEGDDSFINELTNSVSQSSNSEVLPVVNPTVTHSTLNHTLNADTVMNDPFGLGKRPMLAVLLLFLAGLVLAFSACVYPMIPIVTNIVARQHKPTAFKGFLLTLAYGLGVATSYGLLGAVVAFFGRSLGIIGWMQNPWVLLGFGVIFVLLALYMLGIVHFRLPAGLTRYLHRTSSTADNRLGSVSGSFLVGLLSALVVSPCVSAPLGGALFAVATIGNVALGFVALFALGLGLSTPLIVMGAAQGKLMPKSGDWMDGVRHFGGFLLLAVAILLINRVFLNSAMLVVWAAWFALFALWLWQWRLLVLRAVAVLMVMWAALLMIGASIGSHDVLQPLAKLTEDKTANTAKKDIVVTSLQDLDVVLLQNPKVLAYVTADWCVECRIMQKTLFTNRPSELAEYQLVKVDITDTTEDSRAVLERYGLFGAPAFLYYKDGALSIKQIGEVKREDFVMTLSSL